jgi:hypothetical protein
VSEALRVSTSRTTRSWAVAARLAAAATLMRLEHLTHAFTRAVADMLKIPLEAAVKMRDEAELMVALAGVYEGRVSAKDALTLLGGRHWRAVDLVAQKVDKGFTDEEVGEAVAALREGVEKGKPPD